jgi:hypothetical protein
MFRKLHFAFCALVAFSVVSLIALHSAHAGIRPSFSFESCTWHSTHIVLVEANSTEMSSKPRVEFARPMEQVRRHSEWGVQVLRALATSKLSAR